jgi:hypothetical protein
VGVHSHRVITTPADRKVASLDALTVQIHWGRSLADGQAGTIHWGLTGEGIAQIAAQLADLVA